LTRTVPYESCSLSSQPFGSTLPNAVPRSEHCRLRFDESGAAMHGVAIDARCSGRPPIYRLSVILEEVEPGPNGFRELRSTTTDPRGGFAIHSIRPGTRYLLSVTNQPVPFTNEPVYQAHEDTVEFTAGETRVIEVEMQRVSPC
jgi:hypothetical protein